MQNLHHKHDRFFKAMMHDKAIAKDFLQRYLPKNVLNRIDLSELKVEDTHYIDRKLRASESDVLFSVKQKNSENTLLVFILCEHQSTSDPLMPYRLLSYSMDILARHLKNNTQKPLPLPFIYPMVLYNGETGWVHDRSFFSLFGDWSTLAEQVFMQPFYLLDVHTLDAEDISKEQLSNLMLACLRRTQKEQLLDKYRFIQELLLKCKIAAHSDRVYIMLEYLMQDMPADEETIAAESLLLKAGFVDEYQEVMMNLHEAIERKGFKEGMQQGMQQGVQQGMQQKNRDVAINLMRAGVDLHLIAQCTGFSIRELEQGIEKETTH